MGRVTPVEFPVLRPDLQVSFSARLRDLETHQLQAALAAAVGKAGVKAIDRDLQVCVPDGALAKLAGFGLRGEQWFAVPAVLEQLPALLGYYRLLLGFSQKEFYSKGPFGRFKSLEEHNTIPIRIRDQVLQLCRSLVGSAVVLLDGVPVVERASVRDLQLLTLGAQFRGSNNNTIGQRASLEVLGIIRAVVKQAIVSETTGSISLRNASGRLVRIMVSADPDISVIEETESGPQPKLSLEIKGGADESNKHNRLGEAEKSHIKAKERGFIEFWTLVRVALSAEEQRRGSPTTRHFFQIDRIADRRSGDHVRFRDQLCSVLGIRVAGSTAPQRKRERA